MLFALSPSKGNNLLFMQFLINLNLAIQLRPPEGTAKESEPECLCFIIGGQR
jgi:hypothetical protein